MYKLHDRSLSPISFPSPPPFPFPLLFLLSCLHFHLVCCNATHSALARGCSVCGVGSRTVLVRPRPPVFLSRFSVPWTRSRPLCGDRSAPTKHERDARSDGWIILPPFVQHPRRLAFSHQQSFLLLLSCATHSFVLRRPSLLIQPQLTFNPRLTRELKLDKHLCTRARAHAAGAALWPGKA